MNDTRDKARQQYQLYLKNQQEKLSKETLIKPLEIQDFPHPSGEFGFKPKPKGKRPLLVNMNLKGYVDNHFIDLDEEDESLAPSADLHQDFTQKLSPKN